MEIRDHHWDAIRKTFGDLSHTTVNLAGSPPYLAFATVNDDGSPHVAPMGSLILGPDRRGFYFEELSRRTPQNLDRNQKVCVLIVNPSKWFWVKSLFLGRMKTPPAIRLVGTAGEKRAATAEEIDAFQRPIKAFKQLKGYKLLWENIGHVREIRFQSFEPVQMGPFKHLETI